MIRLVSALIVLASTSALGSGLDEFKVKRQEVFEFTEKPTLSRDGDNVTIRFASKGCCDATVAIENANGRIVRHLASGILGDNAPEPFQKGTTKQVLVWDGKNDKGEYIDDKASLTVRVSLGLKPRFERTLNWAPTRRSSTDNGNAVSIAAAPEGVYVFDGGQDLDHVRLFSHSGDYLRTVYPFPAEKLKDVQGLIWNNFIQDGARLPIKTNYHQSTFLTSGDSGYLVHFKDGHYFQGGMNPGFAPGLAKGATTDLAVAGTRMVLAAFRLARLSTDGTSGGLPLNGPDVDLKCPNGKVWYTPMAGGYPPLTQVRPHRFALSPDGKTVYLTGYTENFFTDNHWQHGVYRMAYDGDKSPALWLGATDKGSDATHFNMPSDVAVDSQGRVYVADHGNNRVQVYKPDGTFVTSIPVQLPVQLTVSPKTGELAVFSWLTSISELVRVEHPFTLRRFKSADDPKLIASYDLPIAQTNELVQQSAKVDYWSDPPTVWINPAVRNVPGRGRLRGDRAAGILLMAIKGDRLEPLRDFDEETRQAIAQTAAPTANRQRLYWDPRRERLYVGEGAFSFHDASVIDPATGKVQLVQQPFDAEDMCFDNDGLAYLRTPEIVARYDPDTWREVPWDYGEERPSVGYAVNLDHRMAKVLSGLPLPVNIGWHHGGMFVSPKGNLAVACLAWNKPLEQPPAGESIPPTGKPYSPRLYPGRVTQAAYGCEYIHVWDTHGQILYSDAIPGLGTLNGLGIDNQDGLYVLSAAPRILDGKPYFNYLAGTLMKFKPQHGRIISDSDRNPVQLSPSDAPKRPPDQENMPGNAWVTGGEWLYGGVGWHGKNNGIGCGCSNTRFALDFFGRSFAPEMDRYSVAVLDPNGNLILRIGTYGNVDDGRPLVSDGGPANTRSIGGDEVALMDAGYLATQTDRRLFIADIGNFRLLSVQLGYNASVSVPLKGVPDGKQK